MKSNISHYRRQNRIILLTLLCHYLRFSAQLCKNN